MEHEVQQVTRWLDIDTEPYEAVCFCGESRFASTESLALTKLDDHLLAVKQFGEHSTKV